MNVLLIDPTTRTAELGGRRVVLGARAFTMLQVLASEPDRYISTESLKAQVWPGRVLEEQTLRMQVLTLRKSLGSPQVVLHAVGQGYKLGVQVRWQQAEAAFQPAGQVPHWPEPLLGREAESAALMLLLDDKRLVTILGPGGIGKTRLAQHLLLQRQALHAHSAWWVDLARLPHHADAAALAQALAQAVASALGLPGASLRGEGAAAQLGLMLASWQGLLLLDNAEHLAGPDGPAAPLVQALLAAAPGLRLLVTTQRVLHLPEEWVFRLGTLAVPGERATPSEARSSPALQLLLRRARAADQHFELPAEDLPAACAVVRHLDGIALAIEMAAARLPLLGAALLNSQLAARLQLLGGNHEAALPRHRTLRAALDWSHALLSPAEQAALRRLSVFAGPFRLASAQQLVQVPGLDDTGVLLAVQGLVDKSLLQLQPAPAAGLPARLRLLESTRLYAAEALAAHPGELQATRARHALVMAELARQAGADTHACSDTLWTARWLPDHEDLALGFDHAHALGDADSAGQIIELLVMGSLITGQPDWAIHRWEATRALALKAEPLARARLLGWGNHRVPVGSTRVQAVEQRVQHWRQLGHADRLCASLAVLARTCEHAGDPAGADAALAECEALENPAWPVRVRVGCTWTALSELAVQRCTPALMAAAETLARQLLPALQRLGAEVELLGVWQVQAKLLGTQGRLDEALQVLQMTTQLCALRGWRHAEGVYLGLTVGMLVALAEAPAEARAEARGNAAGWLHQACQTAERALLSLGTSPHELRRFIASMALLACRVSQPEQAAMLLAGGHQLQRRLQYAPDAIEERAAAQLQQALQTLLSPQALAAAEATGQRLDAHDLRLLALAWLQDLSGLEQAAAPSAN